MRFSGEVPFVPAANDGVFGEGPVFLHNDPASEHLLYARAAWGIKARLEMPAAIPAIAPSDAPTTDAEAHRLIELWTRAWDSVWAMHCESYDAEDLIPVTGFQQSTQLIDWLSLALPSGLTSSGFDTWVRNINRRDSSNLEYDELVAAASSAYDRGLRCVFVLPVAGHWFTAIGGRILLVSTGLHDSTFHLNEALTKF